MQLDWTTALWTRFLDDILAVADALKRHLRPVPVLRGRVEDDGTVCFVDPPAEPRRVAATAVSDLGNLLIQHPKCEVRLELPAAWLVRKDLPSVTREAIAFLPAFVSNQIERLTPWRVADVAYVAEATPDKKDKNWCSVALFLAPKHRIAKLLEVIIQQGHSVTLFTQSGGRTITFPVSQNAAPVGLERRWLAYGLGVFAVTTLCAGAVLIWMQMQTAVELRAIADRITAKKSLLVRLETRTSRVAHSYSPLRVQTLENLSRLMPDGVYLTSLRIDNDRVEVSGVAGRATELVSVLEGSKQFADVAFTAPTTRRETGAVDQFQLAMKILPDHEDEP